MTRHWRARERSNELLATAAVRRYGDRFQRIRTRTQTRDLELGLDYAWTVLARVLSVAKDRGKIAVSVCERFRKVCAVDSLLLARILLEGRFTKIRSIEWLRKRRNLRVVNGPRMT